MKRLFLGLALVFLVAPQAQAISRFFEITPENCRKVDVKFDVQVSRKETSPLKVVLGKPTHASPIRSFTLLFSYPRISADRLLPSARA